MKTRCKQRRQSCGKYRAAFTGKDDDKAEIFSAHLDMVDDEEISEEIRSAIHAGTGAAKAVEQGIPAVCRSVGSPG